MEMLKYAPSTDKSLQLLPASPPRPPWLSHAQKKNKLSREGLRDAHSTRSPSRGSPSALSQIRPKFLTRNARFCQEFEVPKSVPRKPLHPPASHAILAG